MSLARLAHRLTLVQALRGRTLAGQAVKDSAIPDIQDATAEAAQPYIAVYTDDQVGPQRHLEPPADGNSPTTMVGLKISIEIGVTAQSEVPQEWDIPTTDAGIELTLDAIERQILIVLADEANGWAELWRRLHRGDPAIKSIRGASAENGIRFAGRQIELTVQPLTDPPFGPAATGIWAQLLAALDAEPVLALPARVLRSLLEAPTPPPSWAEIRRAFAMDDPEARALLLDTVAEATLQAGGDAVPAS